ncbi:hypothetical protein OG887_42995 (plasmid) [Streptomyces sp. NBC_00053]|nr:MULTISPECIES: hypothetical protein [unclassified Streptomyces]WSG56134.1 hypothetical protein OHA38_41085 [Streptomyces sp. NBC_01732]WSW02994.1 hypothetical protein OG298_00605 [Streptomyces sp. NBC_01005]WSX07300.1 hypothetical protein OG355_43950 [Streptomyces sp. NBC_00987]WTC92500.1 hypothetical protein OH736_00605 [Streptomyces sp. NBC_01650]MCX4399556.1 hypothetical protein [Streptomyces sp. NBC_01767]
MNSPLAVELTVCVRKPIASQAELAAAEQEWQEWAIAASHS